MFQGPKKRGVLQIEGVLQLGLPAGKLHIFSIMLGQTFSFVGLRHPPISKKDSEIQHNKFQ